MESSLTEVLVMFVDSLFNEDGAREITLGIITDLILIIFAFRTYTPATWRRFVKENPRAVATPTISMFTQEKFWGSI